MMPRFVITFTFVLVSISTYAASPDEFYIQQAIGRYFYLPQGTRSLATAGAGRAVCNDVNCAQENPSGLGQLRTMEGVIAGGLRSTTGNEFITENNIDQSEGSGFAILAVPLGSTPDSSPRFGTLALAFSRYQGETNDIVKTTPDGHRRTVSYGITLENETSVGYSFTFYDDQLQSQLADLHSHARLLHVFGMKTPLDAITTLGATFEYGLGQSDTEDYRLGSDGLSHLKQYTGTVSVERQLGNVGDLFAFDVTRVSSEGNLTSVSAPVVVGGNEDGVLFNARAGIDAEVAERFFIRGGTRLYHTRYDFDRENLRSLSGTISGFGVSAGIDYTFPYSTDSPLRWNLSYGAEYLNVSDGASKQLTSLKITQNS